MEREVNCIISGSYNEVKCSNKRKHSVMTYRNDSKRIDGFSFTIDCAPVGLSKRTLHGVVRAEDKRNFRSYAQTGQKPEDEAKTWHQKRSQSVANLHSSKHGNNDKVRTRRTVTVSDVLTSRKSNK